MSADKNSKLFDTLMVFQKEVFEKVDFEKNQHMKISMQNYQGRVMYCEIYIAIKYLHAT